MSATLLGVAAPAQTNTRPSGRYRVIAPEAPIGSILRVTTREGSIRFVQLLAPHGLRLFVGLDGERVEFCQWDYATRAEADCFRREREIATYADGVEIHGAPSFAAKVRGLPRLERDELLRTVADELRVRGKDGKASQVLAYRFEEE